jgi:hypothetical protein
MRKKSGFKEQQKTQMTDQPRNEKRCKKNLSLEGDTATSANVLRELVLILNDNKRSLCV